MVLACCATGAGPEIVRAEFVETGYDEVFDVFVVN